MMDSFDLAWMADKFFKTMEVRGLSIEDMKLVAKGLIDMIEVAERDGEQL